MPGRQYIRLLDAGSHQQKREQDNFNHQTVTFLPSDIAAFLTILSSTIV